MGTVRTADAVLHFTRTGGEHPPVVLLHGLTGSSSCWSHLAGKLTNQFDVIMPDARGHGRSSAPSHGFSYIDHAHDVLELVTELELASPVLAGHSMGGMTAALVAQALHPHPRGLILLEPSFLTAAQKQEVRTDRARNDHEALLQLSLDEIVAQAQQQHPLRSGAMVQLVCAARAATCPEAFDVLLQPIPDHLALMQSIAVPVLLVLGEDSPVLSEATVEDLCQCTPHLQVEYIGNAGHGVHYDQPERVAEVVQSFLTSLSAFSPVTVQKASGNGESLLLDRSSPHTVFQRQ